MRKLSSPQVSNRGTALSRKLPTMVRHERRIIAAQEAPPNLVLLRNGHGAFCKCSSPALRCRRLGRTLSGNSRPLHSRAEDENGTSMIIDGVATAGKPAAISVRKPMFLQKERWEVIQKARRKGTSFQASGQKLGIHRGSIKKYLDAEVPPTRQSRVVSSTSSPDNIAAQSGDIYAERLTGHFP